MLVTAVQPTYFMKVLGINSQTLTARAVATNVSGVTSGGGCLYTLGSPNSAIEGVNINGNATLNATTCGSKTMELQSRRRRPDRERRNVRCVRNVLGERLRKRRSNVRRPSWALPGIWYAGRNKPLVVSDAAPGGHAAKLKRQQYSTGNVQQNIDYW